MDAGLELNTRPAEEDSDSSESGISESGFAAPAAPRRVWSRRAILRCAGGAAVLGLLLAACAWRGGGARAGPSGGLALRGAVELDSSGDCKSASAAWCEHGKVSLYCFSQMMASGPEADLVRMQLQRRISIFACDDFDATCAERINLGKGEDGEDVYTVVNPESGRAKMGDISKGATTTSFLNVLIFMKAWDILIARGKVWKHDWTVKVDPDAVFFPHRLRPQLQGHTGPTVPATYVLNCKEKHWKQDKKDGSGHFYFVPKLYGALEVYNMKSLGAYKDAHKVCLKKLPWKKWGEDLYMRMCMELLNTQRLLDYELVGDDRCPENPHSDCWEANRPAYHPYKQPYEWSKCYNQSAHIKIESPAASPAAAGGAAAKSGGAAKPFGACGGAGKPKMACPHGFKCNHASRWYWQCVPAETLEADV